MYDEALLKELTELENTVRFDSFDFNDAYALGSALRAAGEKAPKPIAVRIVLDGMILYQSFLPGTDATNNNWMDKKQPISSPATAIPSCGPWPPACAPPWSGSCTAPRPPGSMTRSATPSAAAASRCTSTASSAVRRLFPVCRI